MLRRHFIINTDSGTLNISNNEIWYTSSDGIITPYKVNALPNIASNKCVNGKGVIKFETDVINIGDDAFQGCSSLTSITIPNSVTSIGVSAFAYCKSLTSIIIPNNVKMISAFTFGYCWALTSVIIPNSVTYIAQMAFLQCSGLTSVTIPNSVTNISNDVFNGCVSLKSITYTGTISQWNAITKGTNWCKDVPAKVVHCTDGDVEI